MKKITLQEFLDNHVWKIQQCLGLEAYDTTIVYHKHGWKVAKGILMEVKMNYKYLRIEICYGDDAIKNWKKKWHNNLIEALCHEISHLYTNWVLDFKPKRTELFDHQFEFYTSMLDRIVTDKYWLYMEKYKINKKTGIIK